MSGPQQSLLSISSGGLPATGLIYEHRADQLTAGNNNPISTWVDNFDSKDLTSSSSDRPTQRDSTLNSLPTAEFNGLNLMTLSSLPGTTTNLSYFAVMKGTDFSNRTLLGGDGGPQVRLSGQKINFLHGGVLDMGSSATSLTNGVFYIIAVTYDGSTVRFYVNGAADGTHSVSHTMTDPVKYLGVRDGFNEFFFGNVAHQAFYNAALSAGNVTAAFDYMNNIWAVY